MSSSFENNTILKECEIHQLTILANDRFLLASKDVIAVMNSGKLDLFAFSHQDMSNSLKTALKEFKDPLLYILPNFLQGPLQFLASFQEGDWLFPFPMTEHSIGILAIAREDCQFTLLDLPALRQVLPRSSSLQILMMHQMQNWIRSFNLKKFSYPSSSIIEFLPLHPESLLEEHLWSEFFLFEHQFLSLIENFSLHRQILEKNEALLRIHRDDSLLDQSISKLKTLLSPQISLINPTKTAKEDLLFRVCQIVGDYLGLKFIPPVHFVNGIGNSITQIEDDHLETLCLNSQIFFRRVRLVNQWWQKQSFPYVSFYREKQQPVALLPLSSGEYQAIDPMNQTKVTVNQKIANQISSYVYLFYRQLHGFRLNLHEMWNFLVKPRKREWLSFLFLVLCNTLMGLSFPILTQFLFDEVIPNRSHSLLIEVALGAIVISLATLAFNFGRETLILRLESLSDHDLEMAIWQRLILMPLRFFQYHSLYELFTFISAIGSIRKVFIGKIIENIFNIFFSISFLILMFYYSWSLAFVGIAILTVKILAIMIFFRFGIYYGRQLLDKRIQANNKMVEIVHSLTKVRLGGAETRMFHRWEQVFAQMIQMDLKLSFLQMKIGGFNAFWTNATTWIFYFFLIFTIYNQQSSNPLLGSLTLGSFLAFLSAFGLFNSAITRFNETTLRIIEAIPLWEKVRTVVEAEPEEATQKADPGYLEGEIRIDQLTFGYQTNISPIIKNISLVIHPGECVAFVGPSGRGKTTLLRLILGFEKPNQGSIYYDNKDVKGLNLQAVRRQLGVVLQSGAIFDGTILDNVNSGRHYSSEEIEKAFDVIGARSFIQELSMGINTVLTNGGLALSGGQRQLIMLARAVVGKPKILILDEATSSLDNEKQQKIYHYLSKLSMTQIIVAQRLTTVQHANRIYVMDKGEIIDQGNFAQLANRPGFFADMLAQQTT